jgi:hypothetical protein
LLFVYRLWLNMALMILATTENSVNMMMPVLI